MFAHPAKEEEENPGRRKKREGNHWLFIALGVTGGKTNVEYKTHRRLELDRLIAYSLLGTAGTLFSPYVAREAVSISKTNRWEAEGCESFSDRPKTQWVWRNTQPHEIQPTLVKEPLFSRFIRCCSFTVTSASSV